MKYDGPVLLFLSAEHAEYEYDRHWAVFAPNVNVCLFLGTPENPTTHESFIRGERVRPFAERLEQWVELVLQASDRVRPNRTRAAEGRNPYLDQAAG